MRLIDADKLETEIEELIRVRYEWISDSRAERRGLDIALCTVEDAPTVDAIPVEWIKKYEKTDDLAASIYRMLEAWGVDMSDEGETV